MDKTHQFYPSWKRAAGGLLKVHIFFKFSIVILSFWILNIHNIMGRRKKPLTKTEKEVIKAEDRMRPVACTSHIIFDEDLFTFYIYSGSSLYAFAISPERDLEHLYYGPSLSRGFDLRFVSNSSRTLAFNTIQSTHKFGVKGTESSGDIRVLREEDENEMNQQVRDGLCESLLRTMTVRQLAVVSLQDLTKLDYLSFYLTIFYISILLKYNNNNLLSCRCTKRAVPVKLRASVAAEILPGGPSATSLSPERDPFSP